MTDQMLTKTDDNSPATVPAGEMSSLPILDLQRRMAADSPRNPTQCVERSIQELRAFPDFAEKAYYSIPYKDNRSGRTVYVEGPGIKASNAMARAWGNNASGWRISEEREDRFILEGYYFDFETNRLVMLPFEVNRFYRSREGKLLRRNVNELHLAIQAGGSKVRRNAELAGLPVAFVEMYFAESKRIATMPKKGTKEKSLQERIGDAKAKFSKKYNATVDEVNALIANKVADEDGNIDDQGILAFLIGVWNGLEDGQSTPDVVFSRAMKTAPAMPEENQPTEGSDATSQD